MNWGKSHHPSTPPCQPRGWDVSSCQQLQGGAAPPTLSPQILQWGSMNDPLPQELGQGQGEKISLWRLEEDKDTGPLPLSSPRSSLLWGGLPVLGLDPAPGPILSWALQVLGEEKVGWAPGKQRLRQIQASIPAQPFPERLEQLCPSLFPSFQICTMGTSSPAQRVSMGLPMATPGGLAGGKEFRAGASHAGIQAERCICAPGVEAGRSTAREALT